MVDSLGEMLQRLKPRAAGLASPCLLVSLSPRLLRTRRRRVKFGLIVLALGIFLRCSVADLGRVAGGSMRPTLRDGDYILTNKLAYGFRLPFTNVCALRWSGPQPGDVVVLTSPVDGRRLVKRIIAGPGDALRDGYPSGTTVPCGQFFVRGDDADSIDSRTFGCVPRDRILGQVVGIVHTSFRTGTQR